MALLFAPAAAREIERMLKADRDRMVQALQMVADEPSRRLPFVTEMAGRSGEWRLRKGNWRAIFRVEQQDVVVLLVGHRREIYR